MLLLLFLIYFVRYLSDSVHHFLVLSIVAGVAATRGDLHRVGGIPISAHIARTETAGECEEVARFCPFFRDASRASNSTSFPKRGVFLSVVLSESRRNESLPSLFMDLQSLVELSNANFRYFLKYFLYFNVIFFFLG